MSQTLYKKTASLTDEVFQNPPAEYRGAPFWAWNGDLRKEYLAEQIDVFEKMGLGGAHLHVRTGLSLPYLGEEHMDRVRFCTDKFKEKHMLSYLYDEDRWPSGAAGGIVTKTVKYRAKGLLLTVTPREEDEFTKLLACYDLTLDADGFIKSAPRVEKDALVKEGARRWYAYRFIDRGPDSWFNGQTYIDTLDNEAMREFIRVTYEAYEKKVGDEFGKTVPSIFTDEPQFKFKTLAAFSTDTRDLVLPWTEKLPERYKEAYGEDILDYLPEMFWELPDGKVSSHRYRLHDLITELFACAFGDQCGKWCDDHGIMLTGHLLLEETLQQQTSAIGETMRSYRGFGLPGIDILCDQREYSTAKQCQSAVHQYGRCGMTSELYGVTNWDYDFRGHKSQGDWQAALGVTTRVHHLAWYSMEGEAKRDYPASIGYQSAWYEKYKYIEDHFARVNTALTRGKADVRIGVIHPIESYWLHYGPNDKTEAIRVQMESNFQNVIRWLLFGMIDFDFVCESILPDLCKEGSCPLSVGEMKYDVIVVPACETLRSSTLERLEAFRKAGGKLIFMGKAPTLCDAIPSERGKALYEQSEVVPFSKIEILKALDGVRNLSMIRDDGVSVDGMMHQMRVEENGTKWLFIAQGQPYKNIDIPTGKRCFITIRGVYTPTLYDTLTGKIEKLPYRIENGNTVITRTIYDQDSLLLKLEPQKDAEGLAAEEQKALASSEVFFPWKNRYSLSEDNVYVLDMARYALDEEPLSEREEEILRIDTICRKKLSWPQMSGHMVQPWLTPEGKIEHFVKLRYVIPSEIDFTADLAIEKPDMVKITLNGQAVKSAPNGYFADRYIGRIPLPALHKGENILEVICPLGSRTAVECAYLLGNFGVRVIGREKTVTALPETLCFDDLRIQGLPFYGANVTYHCDIETKEDGTLSLHAPVYRGALLSVALDGKEIGNLVFSPYTMKIPNVSAGKHRLDITLYGTRFNCFGELHFHHHMNFSWYGPTAYRSTGDEWYYEYETKPMGLLRTPVLSLEK